MSDGRKDDVGKPRAGLVLGDFSRALMAVAEVGTFGAERYGASNWLKVEHGPARYKDALWRHLLAEGVDDDSGLLHAAHAAWNALAVLELELRARGSGEILDST